MTTPAPDALSLSSGRFNPHTLLRYLETPGIWREVVPLLRSVHLHERQAGCALAGMLLLLAGEMSDVQVARRALHASGPPPPSQGGTLPAVEACA